MKVFITGLNGFVAGRLAAHLSKAGHEATGSSRSGPRAWSLGDPPDPEMVRGADVLIHCAHDFTRGAKQKNVEGTLALAEAARKAGVGRQIFVSTLSARKDAVSDYGTAKYEIERVFLERGDTVVRPGTVIGKGGLFGKMAGMIRTKSILPLVDGGKAPWPVIGIADLCRAMEAVLGRAEPREYNLYDPQMRTLKELLVGLRERLGRKTLFLPMPAWMLLVPLTLLRWLHIRTPVDVDNLKGYMKNREQFPPSNLGLVLTAPSSMEEALGAVTE